MKFIIIGGGIGGLSAALALARGRHDVKKRYPEIKPCLDPQKNENHNSLLAESSDAAAGIPEWELPAMTCTFGWAEARLQAAQPWRADALASMVKTQEVLW